MELTVQPKEFLNYGRQASPVGNLWKLFRKSKLWFSERSDRVSMNREKPYYFWCDHWPWSTSLCVVRPILSLVFQGKSKSDAFNCTLSIKAGRSRGIFYQNAALIDGLRFMSRSSDMITHTTWPSIHISFYSTIHPFPRSLYLFSLHTFNSHSIIPHLFFAPCVISLCPLPTSSSSVISCYSPSTPSSLFSSPSVPSEKLLAPAATEFWSATLWSKKACQTAFPINQ